MKEILPALLPVFAVILLGQLLRRFRLFPETFWPPAERLVFYVFFPALLIINTSRASLGGTGVGAMIAAILLAIAIVALLAFVLRRPLALDGPKFTSLLQGAVRPNVYVAFAAAAALFGTDGVTVMSLCVATTVPVVNVLSVLAMVRYGAAPGRATGWRAVARPIATNPLILACLAGLAINVSGVGLPPLVAPFLDILSRASLPLALLAVGAGLDIGAVAAADGAVAAASALKLLVLPALTFVLCDAFGVDGLPMLIAVVFAAMPGSASAYVMARQMGGDSLVMAGSITASTLAAIITLPLIISMLT